MYSKLKIHTSACIKKRERNVWVTKKKWNRDEVLNRGGGGTTGIVLYWCFSHAHTLF
jgi:hypothetical protein